MAGYKSSCGLTQFINFSVRCSIGKFLLVMFLFYVGFLKHVGVEEEGGLKLPN